MAVTVELRRMAKGLALAAVMLVGACSSDNDNNNFTFITQQSFLFFDFPGSYANSPTTLGIATTGNGQGMNAYGVAIITGEDGALDPLEFSLNDNTDLLGPAQTVTDLGGVFRWQQQIPASSPETTLELGLNQLRLHTSSANGIDFDAVFAIIRGSSWMREMAIQFDANRSRWLVLDWARRALLEVDLTTGDKTIVSDAATGSGPAFIAPMDFVVDGDTAYVLDRDLQAIIAVDLTAGASEGNRSVYSQASIPVPAPLVDFGRPFALELDAANQRLFVLDRDLSANEIIEVDMSAGNEGIRSLRALTYIDDGDPDTPEIVVFRPVDLAYYATNNELYIGDAALRGIIKIDLASNIIDELVSPDTDEIVSFFGMQHMIINGDKLYISDSAPRIVDVNLAPNADPEQGPGDRNFLSGVAVDGGGNVFTVPTVLTNFFRFAEAIAVDTAGDRLLVIDNFLGNIVTVALSDSDGGTPTDDTDDLLIGQRGFIAGGATRETGGELTYRDAPSLGVIFESPVDLLADLTRNQLTTIDAVNNRLVNIISAEGQSGSTGVTGSLSQTANSPDETDLIDPRAVEFFGNDYYVVDAITDRVIALPADGSDRSVLSDQNANAIMFDDPVDMVSRDADLDPDLVDGRLYVLDRGRGEIIEVRVDDGTRTVVGTGLTDAVAMVFNADDDNSVAEILVLDKGVNKILSLDLNGAGTALADVVDYGAIDAFGLALDARSTDAANYQVLTINLTNNEVVSIGVGVNNRATVNPAYAPVSNNADTFVAPVAMSFNSSSEKLYVIDEAIRSVFIVDLRWRNIATSAPVLVDDVVGGVDQVDAQRVVISRGTSLNCDALVEPVGACD